MIAVPFLYYSMIVHDYGTKHQPEGFEFPKLLDFWRTLVVAVGTQISSRIVIKLTSSYFYSIAKVKDGGEKQEKYAHKAGSNFHDMIMWTVASVTGYQALLASQHLPWWMGGHDDSMTAFESTMTNNPFCQFPRVVYLWFIYTFGIFFGELVNHLAFRERKNDFGEMLIHHLATCFLIGGSAYAN